MFQGVGKKLDVAGYFVWRLKKLEKEITTLGNLTIFNKVEMMANLDGFLFEVISAEDFFLQGINEHFHLGIPSKEVSEDKLMICGSIPFHVRDAVGYIKRLLSKEKSWLWTLNNYRNEATHREILHFYTVMEGPTLEVRQGEEPQFQIVLDPETKAPKYLRRVDITSEDHEFKYAGTYLFKYPADPSQGHLDIKVADYCEQSLNRMKKFLGGLYSQLKIQVS